MDIRDQEELRRVVREIVEEEIRVYMFYNGKDVISDVVDECLKGNKESENNGADTDSKENMEKIIAQLKEKNRTLESENEVLKNHITGIKCEKNRLVTEFENNRENLKDEFGERHQVLEEKIAQQNSLINDLHSEIAKYKLGNANFENRLDELQCELRDCEVEFANREKTIEALKCELEDREEMTKALKCELEDREAELSKCKNELEAKYCEADKLKVERENMQEVIGKLKEGFLACKNDLVKKNNEAEELKVEVTECKEKLQMRSCEIAELKSESKKLCAVIEELKHALTNKSSEMDKCYKELQSKISEIRAYEQKIVVKDRMISDCKNTIDKKDNEIFKNKEEILMKENMLSNCKKELKETQEKAYKYSRELADQGELTKIADLYKRYMKVSEKTKEGLKNLIRCKDVSTFASCGYNIQTLDNLWEYVNQEIRYGHSIELDILRDFFTYFMEQQNKQYESQVYGVVVPEIKEYFDPTRHTDVDGNSADEVKEVLFPGYGYVQKQTGADQKKGKVKFRNIKKLAIVRTK